MTPAVEFHHIDKSFAAVRCENPAEAKTPE